MTLTPENPTFRIVEIFESLQGEGYHTGMPAIFIRLGKCNLACTWCDTNYHTFQPMPLNEILNHLKTYHTHNIIITGGEPTIHPHLNSLLNALKQQGYHLHIETNGLQPVPPQIDYIATSPKASYACKYQQQSLTHAHEVRIVVDGNILDFCQQIEQRIQAQHYYLSPCEREGSMNIHETIQQLGQLNAREGQHPHWQLSIQTHKWAGIE